jgi:ubiquinone/menaquinone biosynthesis C-methylase UbiE
MMLDSCGMAPAAWPPLPCTSTGKQHPNRLGVCGRTSSRAVQTRAQLDSDATIDPLRVAVLEAYAAEAGSYDSRWQTYTRETLDFTLAALPQLPTDAAVLDVGCGTGAALAALLARPDVQLGQYTGLDPSVAMLSVAQRRRYSGSVPSDVRWLCALGDSAPIPLVDSSVDLVLCLSCLHFMSAPHVCLAEMQRVLRPGGTLLLGDWCADYLTVRLIELGMRITATPTNDVLTASQLRHLVETAAPQMRVETLRTALLDKVWGFMALKATKDRVVA